MKYKTSKPELLDFSSTTALLACSKEAHLLSTSFQLTHLQPSTFRGYLQRHNSATMFTRRACSSVRSIVPAPRSTATGSRHFVAGAVMQSRSRAPALADITPDAAVNFNKKQKEFRDSLIAAQKKKEQQESASLPGNISVSDLLPDENAAIIDQLQGC